MAIMGMGQSQKHQSWAKHIDPNTWTWMDEYAVKQKHQHLTSNLLVYMT